MLTEERQQAILRLLESEHIVKVTQLITLLNASESTIRRDLQELEKQHLLERIHGGAKKIQQFGFEADMRTKSQENTLAKQSIGSLAANLISSEDIIYLDAGTTTFELISHLDSSQHLKVVTNSVKHAAALIDRNINTIILGGEIKLPTNAAHGHATIEYLGQFRFNKVFLGMNGIDLTAGLTTPDPEEAILKRMAIQQSEVSYVLADHSKFGKVTFTQVAPVKSAIIVTDHCPEELKTSLQEVTIIKESDLKE